MSKPPAFQFYVKDWLGSPTRLRMSRAERGLFWDMMALAWDSEEPGTIAMPVETFCKLLGILPKVFRKFLEKFPKTFSNLDGKLVQPKLAAQWLELKQFSEKKRDAANKRWAVVHADAMQMECPASASSSASSSAPKISTSNTNSQERDQLGVRANGQKPPFAPPTHEQVTSYMQERGIPDAAHQAELFIAHHENRHWKLNSGRGARMKNWHLAVVTWQENIQKFASNGNGNRETKNEQARRKTREAAERVRADLGLDY